MGEDRRVAFREILFFLHSVGYFPYVGLVMPLIAEIVLIMGLVSYRKRWVLVLYFLLLYLCNHAVGTVCLSLLVKQEDWDS